MIGDKLVRQRWRRYYRPFTSRILFLGFEYHWGLSRKGKPLVMIQTSKQKFRLALAAIQSWIKKDWSRLCATDLLEKLSQKLLGHWNYYGVSGNYRMLKKFYWQVCRIMYKWLKRRTQKKSSNWKGFQQMLLLFRVPRPRIIGYW